jgi:hypothetical protein
LALRPPAESFLAGYFRYRPPSSGEVVKEAHKSELAEFEP